MTPPEHTGPSGDGIDCPPAAAAAAAAAAVQPQLEWSAGFSNFRTHSTTLRLSFESFCCCTNSVLSRCSNCGAGSANLALGLGVALSLTAQRVHTVRCNLPARCSHVCLRRRRSGGGCAAAGVSVGSSCCSVSQQNDL